MRAGAEDAGSVEGRPGNGQMGILGPVELGVQPCVNGEDSMHPTRARLDREAHRRLEFIPVGVAHASPSEGPQTQPGEAEPAAILATPEVSSRLERGTRPVRSGLNRVTHRYPELDEYADFVTGTRGTPLGLDGTTPSMAHVRLRPR